MSPLPHGSFVGRSAWSVGPYRFSIHRLWRSVVRSLLEPPEYWETDFVEDDGTYPDGVPYEVRDAWDAKEENQ